MTPETDVAEIPRTLMPMYADTLTLTDLGGVILATFFGPAHQSATSGTPARTAVAAIAIPQQLAEIMPELLRQSLLARQTLQADPTKQN